MNVIAVIGTLDTKGEEHAFVADKIRELGLQAMLIDVGTTNLPTVSADVRMLEIISDFSRPHDRGACVAEISRAAADYVAELVRQGKVDGVISLGGGGGTSIGTTIMRALPFGIPKVMVSTLASGNTAHYVGTSDIVMFPSIVDVAGLNRISRSVFSRAAHAICAMTLAQSVAQQNSSDQQPLILASMFGNTTECVQTAIAELEQAGFESLVFHSTGTGGKTMESIAASGMAVGVLDITTTEIADEVVGGILSAGPDRLEAAGRAGIPTVVVPGCVDMVNFGTIDSVPEKFADRLLYQHNEQVTLMRTTPEENAAIARFMANKLNRYVKPPTVILPLGGVSRISEKSGPFYDPKADEALFAVLRQELNPEIPILELEVPVNHPDFAHLCAKSLLNLFGSPVSNSTQNSITGNPMPTN